MAIKEVCFKSYNGRDDIKGWIYTPIRKPKAVVQIVHGFGEHARRYLHMVLAFNEAGFIVCFDDHVAHGKTAHDSDTWGDPGDAGYMTTTEDENTLRKLVSEEFPDLPYVVFGHSWGSMIARNYAAHYGDGLAGLVICGTPGIMKSMENVLSEVKKEIDAGKGGERDPKYLGMAFAGMTDRIENPNTPNDWISADPDVVADHATDPFNNLLNLPTNQLIFDLAQLVSSITGTQWAEKVPMTLPVYNIAGDQDPVGNYGEGVYAVSNWLSETGHKDVTTRLYTGHRHEIHNDRDIRDEVEAGIIDFINRVIQ